MSKQAETTDNPPGLFKKISKFWNGLSNLLKSLTGLIALILLLVSQFDNIKSWLFQSVPDDTISKISVLNTLTPAELENVFEDCLKYKTQCLGDILKECERMARDEVAFKESVEFIYRLNKTLGGDEVFNICQESAEKFADESSQIMNAIDVERGFNFYILILKGFEANHQAEVKSIFKKFIEKINDNPVMGKITQNVLINKID